jgi:hypothetical protein
MNRTELVLDLFKPDENGISRWVSKNECVGKYEKLYPTNGNQWYRNRGISHLIFKKEIFNGVIHWKFDGFKPKSGNRSVSNKIKEEIKLLPCAHTGFYSSSNNLIVVDHKNGRYDDENVLNLITQKISDFQPLTNQSNCVKRTECQKCVNTGERYDAKRLGYSVSVIDGTLEYVDTCFGCYWNDCLYFKEKVTEYVDN